MAPSRRTLSIVLALLISVSFIAAGYALSSPFSALRATATTNEALLRQYAEQDTDRDGLTDWQEDLYGSDPENPNSIDPGKTDREAVDEGLVEPRFASEPVPEEPIDYFDGDAPATSGSFTERFSREFFTRYMADGQAITSDPAAQQELVVGLLTEFAGEAESLVVSSYDESSVRVVAGTTANDYVAGLERILYQYEIPDDWEIATLASALIERTDESARPKLERFESLLTSSVKALAAQPVPPSLVEEHLALVKAADESAQIAGILSRYDEDPVGALGALGQYADAAKATQQALRDLAPALLSEGTPAPGSFAAKIVEFSRLTPPTP